MSIYLANDTPQNTLESILQGATKIASYDDAVAEMVKQNFHLKMRLSEISILALCILGIITGVGIGWMVGAAVATFALVPAACLWAYQEKQKFYIEKIKEQEKPIENILLKAVDYIKALQKFKAEKIIFNAFGPSAVGSILYSESAKMKLNASYQNFCEGRMKLEPTENSKLYENCMKLEKIVPSLMAQKYDHCVPQEAWKTLQTTLRAYQDKYEIHQVVWPPANH